jgi:hypothetical protein
VDYPILGALSSPVNSFKHLYAFLNQSSASHYGRSARRPAEGDFWTLNPVVGRSNRSGRAKNTDKSKPSGLSEEPTESTGIADVWYKTGTPSSGADPVEEALAIALDRASAEQRWDAVSLLGRELEARRLARGAKKVPRRRPRKRQRGQR